MQSLDLLIKTENFDNRLETDLFLPDLTDRLGVASIEMERVGLGVWNVVPVNLDDRGHILLGVPKDGQDSLGTSVFYQTAKGLTGPVVAGILARLLDRTNARFMHPDGDMITPVEPEAEPVVENKDGAGLTMN